MTGVSIRTVTPRSGRRHPFIALGERAFSPDDDQTQRRGHLEFRLFHFSRKVVPVSSRQTDDAQVPFLTFAQERFRGFDHRLASQHEGGAATQAGINLLRARVKTDGGELQDAIRGLDIIGGDRTARRHASSMRSHRSEV